MLKRIFTKNLKEIPLIWMVFNLQHFKNIGKENSCMLKIHPNLREDKHIVNTLNSLVDYIRDNYDMEKLV